MPGKEYNGHKNWTHWNVSLWINNDEGLYFTAVDYVKRFGKSRAARKLLDELPKKTPDGATCSFVSVLAAISEMA